ncbi:MAG TPA: hypothetical protein VMK12_26000 [Anaeromyxobacteraceae bacterium]|nr:hypothetical protein [Anaeromyxobacteraceae bacterium]
MSNTNERSALTAQGDEAQRGGKSNDVVPAETVEQVVNEIRSEDKRGRRRKRGPPLAWLKKSMVKE